MLLKEIYQLWRKDNSLSEAINDSHNMLEHTLEMFQESILSLRQSDAEDDEISVYEKDQIVNKYIRVVRRKVLQYLAVTGGLNIIPGLILSSIVIDIERIGDYTKNIADLAIAHPKRLTTGNFEDDFLKIEQTILSVFKELIPMLKESDKVAAAGLIENNYWVLKKCDDIINFLVKEGASSAIKDAATCALYTRYLKRTAAHLYNIASSIVNPYEHIGFKSENEEI